MALNGTLQTLSLPNLIQLHCGQQQNALVRLVRPGREGMLAFASGKLIYASTATRTGEQAIHEFFVRVHIQRLRQKLEDDPDNPRYILNVRGRGYRFVG